VLELPGVKGSQLRQSDDTVIQCCLWVSGARTSACLRVIRKPKAGSGTIYPDRDKTLLYGPSMMGTSSPGTSAGRAPASSPEPDRPIDEGDHQNDHAYDQQVGQAISDDADDTQNDRHNDQQ
jgi:hypothetical protein